MTIKLLVIPGWAAPSRGRVVGCHAFHPAPGCAHSATSIELFAYPAKPPQNVRRCCYFGFRKLLPKNSSATKLAMNSAASNAPVRTATAESPHSW
jgi:hypothetical protein